MNTNEAAQLIGARADSLSTQCAVAMPWSAIIQRSRDTIVASLKGAAMRHAGAASLACERAYGHNEHCASIRAYRVAMHYFYAIK